MRRMHASFNEEKTGDVTRLLDWVADEVMPSHVYIRLELTIAAN